MTDGGDQFPNRTVQQRSALPVQFPVVPIPSKARDGHFGPAAVCGISAASQFKKASLSILKVRACFL